MMYFVTIITNNYNISQNAVKLIKAAMKLKTASMKLITVAMASVSVGVKCTSRNAVIATECFIFCFKKQTQIQN